MSDGTKLLLIIGIFTAGFICGIETGAARLKNMAINHHAAQYNPTNGVFEWTAK